MDLEEVRVKFENLNFNRQSFNYNILNRKEKGI